MTDTEYRKELLLAKIDAHRQIFRLEVHSARVSFDPVAIALRWVGLDPTTVGAVLPAARSLLRTGLPRDLMRPELLLAVVAAVVAAGFGRRPKKSPPAGS